MSSLGPFDQFKVLHHIDTMKAISSGRIVAPVTVSIEPCSGCNYNCIWCSSKKYREENPSILSKELLNYLPTELAGAGVKAVLFTGGGEPMLNPHLLDAMPKYKTAGLQIGVITNGAIFRTIDDFFILAYNCEFIRVSIDAIKPETYELVHGTSPEMLGIVLQYLKRLINARDKLSYNGSKKCEIGVSYLLSPVNLDELETAIIWFQNVGVDYVQIKPVFSPRNVLGNDRGRNELYNIVEEKAQLWSNEGFSVYFLRHYFDEGSTKYIRPYHVCLGHWLTANILSNGKLSICCQTTSQPNSWFGNLYANHFEEIWRSGEHQRAIDNIDLLKCKPCKFELYNQMLWAMAGNPKHVNFI